MVEITDHKTFPSPLTGLPAEGFDPQAGEGVSESDKKDSAPLPSIPSHQRRGKSFVELFFI